MEEKLFGNVTHSAEIFIVDAVHFRKLEDVLNSTIDRWGVCTQLDYMMMLSLTGMRASVT